MCNIFLILLRNERSGTLIFLLLFKTWHFNKLIIYHISTNQYTKSHQFQYNCPYIRLLPHIVRIRATCRDSDYDPYGPYDYCACYVADGSG